MALCMPSGSGCVWCDLSILCALLPGWAMQLLANVFVVTSEVLGILTVLTNAREVGERG